MPRRRGRGGRGGSAGAGQQHHQHQSSSATRSRRSQDGGGGSSRAARRSPSPSPPPPPPPTASMSSSSRKRAASPPRHPPSPPKVPAMEPVEQRWEEAEGKYLHKKFKKMASSASAVSDPTPPPLPPPPPREASPGNSWEVGVAPQVQLPQAAQAPQPAHAFPLKHSALSMLSSPPLQPQPPPPIVAATLAAVASGAVESEERKKRNTCPFCQLVCAKPSVLDKHIRTHTNERPYPCRECGFAFKTNSNLSKHYKSRTHALKVDRGVDSSSALILEELGSEGQREEIGSPLPLCTRQTSPPPPPPPTITTTQDTVARFSHGRDALHRLPPQPQRQVTVLTTAAAASAHAPVLPQHPDPRLLQQVAPQHHVEPQQLVIRAVHRPGEHALQCHQQRPAQQLQQQRRGPAPVLYQVGASSLGSVPLRQTTVTTLHPMVRSAAPQPVYTLPSVPHPTVRGAAMEMRVQSSAPSSEPRLPQQPVSVQAVRSAAAAAAASTNPQLPTAPLPLVRAPLAGLPAARTVASASAASASPPQQPADLSKKAESLQQRIEHIDKVISQNQAIVDIVDPIWQRRYMRQNSKEGADDKLARGKPKAAAPSTTAAVVALAAPAISASPPTTVPITPKGTTSAMAAKPVSLQQQHLHQQQQHLHQHQQQQQQQPPLPNHAPLPLTIRHPLPQAPDPAGGVHAVALIKPEMLRLSSAAASSALTSGNRIVTSQQPLELTVNAQRREGKAGEIMLVRQNAVAEAPVNLKRTVAVVQTESTPQSVREVLINSFAEQQKQEHQQRQKQHEQPPSKSNNISHLEDIAGTLEAAGLPFHPQNPEGSMIKELLLKTRLNGLVPVIPSSSALSVSVSNASTPTAPSPRRITAAGTNEVFLSNSASVEILKSASPSSTKPTHIIYADPNAGATSLKAVPIQRSPPTTTTMAKAPTAAQQQQQQQQPQQLLPDVTLVRCTLCQSTFSAADLDHHRKYMCHPHQQQHHKYQQFKSSPAAPIAPPPPSPPKSVVSRIFSSGGIVQTTPTTSDANRAGGLLQIARPGLKSGGVVSLIKQPLQSAREASRSVAAAASASASPSASASLKPPSGRDIIRSIISTSGFTIPGVPTPSLSGVLTGIKSTPLFSLAGKRRDDGLVLSSQATLLPQPPSTVRQAQSAQSDVILASSSPVEKAATVPFVPGMPGPYSQAPETPTVVSASAAAKSTHTRQAGAGDVFAASDDMEIDPAPSPPPVPMNLSRIPEITVSPAPPSSSSSPSSGVREPNSSSAATSPSDGGFLRPSSLSLAPGSFRQKKHVMQVSSTASLISPDTPRPRKSFALTYQNGTAYTHLGLKCSTRSFYCTVHRRQPVFVQDMPRLSMYSNWKMVEKDSHPSGLSPRDSIRSYNSSYKQQGRNSGLFTTAITATGAEVDQGRRRANMIVAHSSQWNEAAAKRAREEEEARKQDKAEKEQTAATSVITSLPSKETGDGGGRLRKPFGVENLHAEPEVRAGLALGDDDQGFAPTTSSSPSPSGSSGDHPPRQIEGGYKTNDDDDYTYVRGRGRGRYVCKSCGIRCKKPSMLKKHIRTHSNFRPYTCGHCNFSFKTKGNLTKHMKSKAHYKKCVELGIRPVPTSVEGADDKQGSSKAGETVPGDSDSDMDDDIDDEEEEDDEQFEDADDDDMMIIVEDEDSKKSRSSEQDGGGCGDESSDTEMLPVAPIIAEKTTKQMMSEIRPTPSLYPYVSPMIAGGATQIPSHKTASSGLATLEHLYEYAKVSPAPPSGNNLSSSSSEVAAAATGGQHQPPKEVKPDPVLTLIDQTVAKAKEATASASSASRVPPSPVPQPQPPHPASSIESVIKQMVLKSETSEEATSSSSLEVKTSMPPSSISDGSFAPRNVTMNVKDLPLEITSAPLPGTSHQNKPAAPEKIKAAATAEPSGSKSEPDAQHAAAAPAAAVGIPVATTSSVTLHSNQDVIQTRADGKSECGICKKVFSKASQLRLHVNIHYMERPFRCEDCAVSFRTKGHLLKHERSAGHFNKVNINQTFGAPSAANPRPFECRDCLIRFRIHGHLAKHLRSKIHIMKLECTGKLPIGIYAEMERLGTNLNEIETTDCKSALKSLQHIAEVLYKKDPSKLPHLQQEQHYLASDPAPTSSDPEKLENASETEADIKTEPETLGPAEVPGTVPMRREQLDVQRDNQQHAGGVAAAAAAAVAPPSSMNGHHGASTVHHTAGSAPPPRWAPFSPPAHGKEDQSTDSENETGPSGANSHPRIALKCPQCPQTFNDMKSLQIHSFVDHEGSSSSPESPHTAHPLLPSRPPLPTPQPPPQPPPLATPATPAPTATTPTLFNGELLAAARMVNMQQHQVRKAATASSATASASASTSTSPPPPNVSLPRQFPSSNRSRESSVASSSSESEDKGAYNCDLCGTIVASKSAFRQHLMSHAAPRPFVCPRCDAGFTLEHQLETHMKLH